MGLSLWPGLPPGADAPGADTTIASDNPRLVDYPNGSSRPRGAVIVMPGGGYEGHAEYEGEPVARWLNGIGFCSFVLHYRVAPCRHPWPLADALRAVRYVRRHHERWGVDPDRIGVLGFSAGGHLAACAGILSHLAVYDPVDDVDRVDPRPDFMVLCYPVITFGAFGHEGSMLNLLGQQPDQGLRRLLSLERSADSRSAPAFLWHTANDQIVPVQNSLLLAEALSGCGVPYELHVFPDGAHGEALFSGREDLQVWKPLCEAWLKRRNGP